MSKQIDALKLALEALERVDAIERGMVTTSRHHYQAKEDTTKAITAIKEALAQLNEFNPDWDAMAVMVEEQQRMAKRIEELEETILWQAKRISEFLDKQKEQEPVVFNTLASLKHKKTVGPIERAMLNTTPPKRKWVGLTEEQFVEAARLAEDGNYLVAFQRIQQWLREKSS